MVTKQKQANVGMEPSKTYGRPFVSNYQLKNVLCCSGFISSSFLFYMLKHLVHIVNEMLVQTLSHVKGEM